MRAAIFIFLLVSVAFGQIPKPAGFVNDFAGIIDDSSELALNNELSELEKHTSVEIAIVTIDSLPPDETIQSYANKLLNEWGIGKQGEDNGLLILIAVQERRIQVETGYGLEGTLPDGRIGRILDAHLEELSSGNYGTALEGIVSDFSEIIRSEYVAGAAQKSFVVEIFPYIVISSILFVIIIAVIYNRFGNRCPKCKAKLHKKDVSTTKIKIYCLQCGWHKYVTHAAGAAVMGMGARGGRGASGGGGFGGGRSGGGGAGRGF